MIGLLTRPLGVAVWFGLLLAGGMFLGGADFLRDYEFKQLPEKIRNRAATKRKFPKDIVLVEINNDSVHNTQRLPLDKGQLATLLANLRNAKPKTIVLDMGLLRDTPASYKAQLKSLLKTFNALHPVPAKPKADDGKKKKRRRRRRLSRRQKAELAQKKALQKKIEAVRKKFIEASKDPQHQKLLKELKATTNLVLGYTYYQTEKDVLGVDGVYYKSALKAARKRARSAGQPQPRPAARKATKKGKKGKKAAKRAAPPKKRPAAAKDDGKEHSLFTLTRSQTQPGAQDARPALPVHFLRDNPIFSAHTRHQGFLNLSKHPGKVFYKARLVVRKGEKVYPSLALAAFIAYKGENPLMVIGSGGYVAMTTQKGSIPLSPDGRMWIDYYGPRTRIPQDQRLRAGDVIAGKNFTASDVQGKLVFVGVSSTPEARVFRTPYKDQFSSLELNATIAANLIQGRTFRRGSKMVEVGILLFLCLLLGGLGMVFRHVACFFITLGLIAALLFADHFFLFPQGSWYHLAYIQVSLLALFVMFSVIRRFTEDVKRDETRSRFQPVMGLEDFQRVLKKPNDIPLDGNWRPITVMAGQTQPLGLHLSDEHNPKQIAKLLSHLVNPIGEAICRNRGTIGQLDGHQFQGFFNAPFDLANHAEQACLAALQMRSECEPFAHQWQLEGLPLPSLSLGLDTGEAITGNFGGTDRFLYSITGPPVELSAQLRELNRHYNAGILISQRLYDTIKDTGRFVVRELDWIRLQEDQDPLTVFELLGTAPAGSPIKEAAEWYQQGITFYRARNFQEAVRYFQEILRVRPDDGPAKILLERSQKFIHYPPSFQWDGTFKVK